LILKRAPRVKKVGNRCSRVTREIFIAAENVSEKVVKKNRTSFMADKANGKVHPRAGLEDTERE